MAKRPTDSDTTDSDRTDSAEDRTDRLLAIPEIEGMDARKSFIRIPPELDVPLTPRVRRIIDTPQFRRLGEIAQLGFVSLVYPGARHTRFEHSLGVYRLALGVLKRLAHDPNFAAVVHVRDAEIFILAALLHDLGHYPYCHLVEDMKLPGIPPHEEAARRFLNEPEMLAPLRNDWQLEPDDIMAILTHGDPRALPADTPDEYERRQRACRLLTSILSGPVDIDKMDYLARDSIVAGVPYGRHFDQERLIGSLCVNKARDGLAITEKGKTAAELLVFARYVMFSEVYWHHAVRSATVMFQRAFRLLAQNGSAEQLVRTAMERPDYFRYETLERNETENGSVDLTDRREANRLLAGIFGPVRALYKRVSQFSIMEEPKLYRLLAGRPYDELLAISRRLTRLVNENAALTLGPNDLLIDAPPVDKEVEFKIDVYYTSEKRYRALSSVSPVIKALAREQFDDYVKRVRVFAVPSAARQLRALPRFDELVVQAAMCDGT